MKATILLLLLLWSTNGYHLPAAFRGAMTTLRSTLERVKSTTTQRRRQPPTVLPFELEIATPPALFPPPFPATTTTSVVVAKPRVWFVLGGPGAGKGTQCAKLSADYGMKHLSAGDLLREECASGSPTGQMISTYIKEGKIVPVEVTVQLLKKAIESSPCNRVLVDGFPRNHDNLAGWDRCMGDAAELEGVMYIDCPEDVMLDRLLARGQTSGRSDDNVETARKRFATYRDATMPVVQHFAALGMLVEVGGHRPVDEVYSELCRGVAPYIETEVLGTAREVVDAIAAGDWDGYFGRCQMGAAAMMEDFHAYQHQHPDAAAATVAVTGTSAEVSYPTGVTRVFHLDNGRWIQTDVRRQ